jgi:sporadic carbohydrate cluster 2OG-Fe(II) oxygenase
MDDLKTFETKGWEIFSADDMKPLDELRAAIFAHAKTLVPYKGEPPEAFFDRFHEYGLDSAELNRVRMDIVGFCNGKLRTAASIHEAFRRKIESLLGPDLVAQKGTNLVIQPPGDKDQSPTHRDAPVASHFEVVVWVPLARVYGTKSMFISDRERTSQALALIQDGQPHEAFCAHVEKQATNLDVKYGQACFFAGGIAHGCPMNAEKETRWSLNMRYKNLFSPYGTKGISDYFDVLTLSPLAKVGFGFEKQEYGGRRK